MQENKKTRKQENKKTNCFNVFLFTCFYNQKGATAFIVIVLISAAVLIMAYNSSLLGLGSLDLSFFAQKGGEAEYISESCIEDALRRVRIDSNYGVGQGQKNLSIGNNSCIINIEANGNERTIFATSTVDNFHKTHKTIITLSGARSDIININSWRP